MVPGLRVHRRQPRVRAPQGIFSVSYPRGGRKRARTMLKNRRLLIAGLLGLAAGPLHAEAPGTLTVFAAASLRNALDETVSAFEAETGTMVRLAYAGSSTLARQITAGAPADVFISANAGWMDHLAERGLLTPESRLALLSNRLVLIAPNGTAGSIDLDARPDLAAALGDSYLAMANTDAVPAGLYGKAALQSLGLWSDVRSRIAQADDVRAALALVSRGEAPLGIVYRSDAMAAGPSVRVMAMFPAGSHPRIVYPGAVLAGSEHPAAAELLRYLAAPARTPLFERWGFERPEP